MSKLFFICPECCYEDEIKFYFDDECYFITSLGVVLQLFDKAYWDGVEDFITEKNIKEIFIAQSIDCSFLETGAYSTEPRFSTKAEQRLIELREKIVNNPIQSTSLKIKLSELNILDSFNAWFANSTIVEQKVRVGELAIKGVILSKQKQSVSQFAQDKGGSSLHYVDLKAFLETNKVASQTQFKLVKND